MKNTRIKASLMVLFLLTLTNCSDDNSVPIINDANTALYTGVLTDLTTGITATYSDFKTTSTVLQNAAATFTIGNDAQLLELKEAWRSARSNWEQSEAFVYGPVDSAGLDPKIDKWPIDEAGINTILEGTEPITVASLGADGTRGFHVIEFLLWGSDGNKTAAQFTQREVEYLEAACDDLKNNASLLFDGWDSEAGNYGSNFINAGQSGSVYTSQEISINTLISGMVTLAIEVADSKIQPLIDAGVVVEESRLSNNSKKDFADNIRSIQLLYLGDSGTDQRGLTDIIAPSDAALDVTVRNAIDEAIQAIEAIPGTMAQALANDPASITNAKEKVTNLKNIMEQELLPLFSDN